MKTRILFFSIAVTALMATSCSIYHPQAVDIPLINHKGDLRIDANASASVWLILPDAVNLNATASYGINDWLSGQLHLNYGGENWYLQAAPGVYFPLGGKAVFETYVGAGYGGASYTNNSSDTVASSYSYNGKYLLPFVQFNIGWRNLGPVDLAFGLKTGTFMPDFEYHKYKSDGTENTDEFVHYNTPNFLLEPQLQFGVGVDKVKFTMRVGYTFMDDLNDASNKMYHDFITVGAGVTLCF
ncbi:MAG: hypothetical protein IKP21_06195 [Bacteroidales bacterium]|nr:hypothetical protein [Bacteroidales bacterium]